MVNINKELTQIKTAIYGKDVRGAIHDGIDKINKESEDSKQKASEAHDVMESIINDGFDNAALEANFEQKLDDEIGRLQPEWTQFKNDTQQNFNQVTSQLNDTNSQLAQSANQFKPNHSVWEEFDQRGVNVTWFGAIADANYYDSVNKKYYKDEAKTIPATDNKTAFQNAVDYMSAKGGGTIYVPDGHYCFRSGVKWQTKVSLIGEGVGNTVFVTEGELFNLFVNTDGGLSGSGGVDDSVWLEDCRFENFEADLEGLTFTGANVNGKALFILYMKRARFKNLLLRNTIGTALGCDFLTQTVIENVVVYNAGRNWGKTIPTAHTVGQSGIGIGSGALNEESVVIKNCHVYNCGNFGIFVETQEVNNKSYHGKIVNNTCVGNRIGIANKGSGGTLIEGNSSFGNVEHGIEIRQFSRDSQIINNKVYDNGLNGIHIDGTAYDGVSIKGNEVYRNEIGVAVMYDTIRLKDVFVSNNNIVNNRQQGVFIGRLLRNAHIANNNVIANGRKNTGRTDGIHIDKGMTMFEITGNNVNDDGGSIQKRAIYVSAEATFVKGVIANNVLEGSNHANNALNVRENQLTNVLIKDNIGYVNEQSGRSIIPDGQTMVKVTFPKSFDDSNMEFPKTVNVTPYNNEQVWVRNINSNSVEVYRSGSVGALEFSWFVKR